MPSTDTQPDVLILGGGLAGASLAWHLAGSCRVRLLEQGARECLEASAQNAGMLRRLSPSADERRLAQRTFDFLQDVPTDDWPKSPFRVTGSVIAVTQPRSAEATLLAAAATDLRAKGVDVQKLDADSLVEVAPSLGRSPISHGFWIPSDGTVDPRTFGQGLIRGAIRKGAEVKFDVRADRLLTENNRIIGVKTNRGVQTAGLVVLATAAWTPRLLQEFGLDRQVRPTSRHAFVTGRSPLSRPDHPWCWIEDANVYARPFRGGFLCSPCDEQSVAPPVGPGSATRAHEDTGALMQSRLARFFPALTPTRLVDGWVGLRTFGHNRNPLIGPDPDLQGLFWLTGLGGSGVSTAFALGERAARVLTASTTSTPTERQAR